MALVIEDSIMERNLLTGLARREGLHVVQASDADSALALVRRHAPDVILLGVSLPGPDTVTVLGRIREEHPSLPVVVTCSRDEALHPESALSLGSVSLLRRPIRGDDLRRVLEDVEGAIEREEEARAVLDAAVDRRTSMTIPGDPALLPRVVAWLAREAREHYPGAVLPLADLKLALYEALANAVEHGSLEIGYAHKGEALDRRKGFRRLLAERLTTPPYAARRVHIRAEYGPEEILYRIRDEGPGFDPERYDPDAALADPARLHGRGLALIRSAMDEVTWTEEGREIRMLHRLAGPGPSLGRAIRG